MPFHSSVLNKLVIRLKDCYKRFPSMSEKIPITINQSQKLFREFLTLPLLHTCFKQCTSRIVPFRKSKTTFCQPAINVNQAALLSFKFWQILLSRVGAICHSALVIQEETLTSKVMPRVYWKGHSKKSSKLNGRSLITNRRPIKERSSNCI